MLKRSLDELGIEEKRELVKSIVMKRNGESDVSWQEICDSFDLDTEPQTLRRTALGVQLVCDADLLNDSHAEAGRLERQKLRDINTKVREVYRVQSRDELIRETIGDAIKSLPPIEINPQYEEPLDFDKSIVICIGDMHYGADIKVKGLFGETINHYNSDVFMKRMAKLLIEVQTIAMKENIDTVHLLIVGDMLDGMIHASQLQALEFGLIESTMRFSEYMAKWIAALGNCFRKVNVRAVTGNHPEVRPMNSKRRQFEDENLERIVMWYIKERLRDCVNIDVCGDCERMSLTNIEGFSFLLVHGDGRKMDTIARDAINVYGVPIDFFICGHTHKEEEIPSGMTNTGNSVIVRVPALCGTSRFAQQNGFGGKPGATIMVIEKGYGRRCVYPIYFNEPMQSE